MSKYLSKQLYKIGTIIMGSCIFLASCSSQENDVSNSAATTEALETTAVNPIENLVKRDFDKYEFTILTAAEQWADKYITEGETGDILDDAVYNRNRTVEELYNITLNYEVVDGYMAGMSTVSDKLRGSVMAGGLTYDLFAASSAYVSALITGGMFANQYDSEYLNFNEPWWYEDINKNLMINNRLYISSGAYGLQTLGDAWSLIFNKNLINELSLDSPYEFVYQGSWTFDKMLELASAATLDLNGDTITDKNDRFGILGTQRESAMAFPYSMGRTITIIGNDGLPEFTGAGENVVEIIDKLSSLYNTKELYYGSSMVSPNEELIPMFNEGKGLFAAYTLRIIETDEIRNSNIDIGILPMPKFNDDQDKYYTFCFADITAIPASVADNEMSCIILEALK